MTKNHLKFIKLYMQQSDRFLKIYINTTPGLPTLTQNVNSQY